jgi:transcription-repair coupling factor (superfamily II helicase)
VKTLSSFQSIFKTLEDAPSLRTLAAQLTTTQRGEKRTTHITIKNAVGSLKSVVAALAWKHSPKHVLVVAPDDDTAEAVRADLETLIGADSVLWYAESDKKLALDAEQLNTQLVGVTGALTELVAMERACIVAPAHALIFPVPQPKALSQNLLEVRRGEPLKFDEFITTLTTSGFDRKDFVEMQGDVAVRGGLVDVFAPGMENPIRIEFFGDEVDSIREFDPLSQRSIKELATAALITHLFHNDEHSVNATLLDYLPAETVLVEIFPEQITAALHAAHKKNLKDAQKDTHGTSRTKGNKNHQPEPEEEPIDTALAEENTRTFLERLQAFRTLEVNPFHEAENAITFSASTHPILNASVTALTAEMRRLAALGYTLYCASDGQEQVKRLRDLIESAFEGNPDSSHAKIAPSLLENDPNSAHASIDDTSAKTFLTAVSLAEGFILQEANIALFTEHQVFMRRRANAIAKEKRAHGVKSSNQGISLKELQQLRRGDYVVHTDKGVAQFDGLETITVGGAQQESVRLIFAGGDKMFVHLNYINRLQKYSAEESAKPTLTKLGSSEWQRKKERTKKRLKDIARDLITLYAQRKMQRGVEFAPDSLWQKELEASFMYEDTPDQASATRAVKDDMESATPMDRLICGDVGFGKTEVAIRAAFKAVQAGKQVAVLVPTTILAEQHLSSFRDRLERYAVSNACLSRFRTPAEQKEILKRVESGSVDILIGTHRILSKDVKFKDLGLLVVDEEHRFGVSAKEKLRQMRATIDTITLTATPIPRTLNFSLMGARDVSVINTPPRNRLPVKTEITVWNDAKLTMALERELQRGGQIFMVNDRIGDLDVLSQRLSELVPSLRVVIAHGQMSPEELENRMERFMERKADVLLATKIIESGIDIPNANTMIIHNSDNFGLAELYQLRGRVGRSNAQAYCYLLIPPPQALSRTALRRLQAMEEFSDLGSGFKLAMRDMEIRGAGNLLGAEQSGFIDDIGFELYQKILDEAVQELKEGEFAEIFAHEQRQRGRKHVVTEHGEVMDDIDLPINDEMTVETDGDAMLPKTYIASEVERYELYKKLFRSVSMEETETIVSEMRDRFGALPPEALRLMDAVHLRIAALPCSFAHVSLKAGKLVCEFPPEDHTTFYTNVFPAMMHTVAQMRDVQIIPKGKKVLIQSAVGSLESAILLLKRIVEGTKQVILAEQLAQDSSNQAATTF